ILVPTTLHPHYRRVAVAMASNQGLRFEELPYCTEEGITIPGALRRYEGDDVTALVIQQPNFFGRLEDVDALTDWAHQRGIIVIPVVNPTSLALLKPPGEWGSRGADIAVGEGQPLGVPLSSGGPYFGFMTTRMEYVRQMPGRIVGRTLDAAGKEGFTLTLQAREQHIRRARATSNICTNHGLLMTAAAIHLSLLGPQSLPPTAAAPHPRCRARTYALASRVTHAPARRAPVYARPVLHRGGPAARPSGRPGPQGPREPRHPRRSRPQRLLPPAWLRSAGVRHRDQDQRRHR